MIYLPSKNKLGPLIISLVTLLPLVLWSLAMPLEMRFNNPFSSLSSLGQIAALAGMSLFAINLILSARLGFFEDFFGGMNRLYKVHHFIGAVSFILLLLHPLLLSTRFLNQSLATSLNFLLPGDYLAKDLGVYALILMSILLILTFFVSIKYEYWKNSHRFLGLAFFIASLHSLLIYSDIKTSLYLRSYMLVLIVMALLAFTYRSVLGRWLIKKHPYILINKEIVNSNATVLRLKAIQHTMPYEAGQFVFATFSGKSIPKETHPFSICCENCQDELSLTVKALGDFTTSLKNIEIGEIILLEGPFGRFNYKNAKSKKQLWIAGGIGITPFLGMAKQIIKDRDTDYKIDFYFSTTESSEQILIRELLDEQNNLDNIHIFQHISGNTDRLNADYLCNKSDNILEKSIFICGPANMMKALKSQFLNAGVKKVNIHTEEFDL